MGLYRNLERILADLEHAGLAGDAPLRVDDLVPYDQYHYEGTDAVDAAADLLAVPNLFKSCRDALRPGARMYIEDYFARGELEPAERAELSKHVCCDYLPDLDTYRSRMLDAGFTVEKAIDVTSRWTDFVVSRLRLFRENRGQLLTVHGSETVDSLDVFYATVVRLFRGGRLGGVRFIARLDASP